MGFGYVLNIFHVSLLCYLLQYTAGKVKKIRVHNFMCHDALEITLNENVNFIVGRNGSGKSAILTALTVGLGARANVTSRGTAVKGIIILCGFFYCIYCGTIKNM